MMTPEERASFEQKHAELKRIAREDAVKDAIEKSREEIVKKVNDKCKTLTLRDDIDANTAWLN